MLTGYAIHSGNQTSDEENGTDIRTSDSLMTSENKNASDSDQNILPEAVGGNKGSVANLSYEQYSANSTNNQTEIIIPTPEGSDFSFSFIKCNSYNSDVFSIMKVVSVTTKP